MYHLCYYFSSESAWDNDRRKVINFKKGDEFAIRRFIADAINLLLKQEMDKELIIIRALNSKEIVPEINGGQSLDRLGQSLAATFGCHFVPTILVKRHLTRPVKSLTLTKRQIELADVYQVSQHSINLNNRKVLIIDDIVTTGLTVSAIIKAILTAFPGAKVSVFALAWTPTKNQQAYLLQMKNKTMHFNEPELPYGNPGIIKDLDFEKGLTNVSLF